MQKFLKKICINIPIFLKDLVWDVITKKFRTVQEFIADLSRHLLDGFNAKLKIIYQSIGKELQQIRKIKNEWISD